MQRLIAFVKSRPKTSIVALVAFAIVVSAIWYGVERKRGYENVTTGYLTDASTGYGGGAVGVASPPVMADSYTKGPMPIDPGIPPMPLQTAGETAADVDQKIIRNGYLTLVVEKVAEANDRITTLSKADGGFVQSSSISVRADGTYAGDITIRVPVAKFDQAMAEIQKLATQVKTSNSTGQDVTEQYSDLQAQLRNAQAQEQTYLEILKQAKTVQDTLAVQAQLGAIRSTIESLQGRIQYLTNTTSYSTISVSLEEEPAVRAPTKEFRPVTIIKQAVQTLVDTVQGLIAGLIYVVIVWGGILIPLAILVWIVVRVWKRKRGPTVK